MPIPVKSNCSARSIEKARLREAVSSRGDLQGCRAMLDCLRISKYAPNASRPLREGPAARSIGEFDMLVEGDCALVVLDDVVAVQSVAILVEVVFALGAREFLDPQNSLADFSRIGRARLVDRSREHGDGIVRPRTLVIRRNLDGVAIGLAESFRTFARIFGVVGNTKGAVERRSRKLQRRDVDDP